MIVRTQFILPAIIALAAGLSQSPTANAEPLKLLSVHRWHPPIAENGWKTPPLVLIGSPKCNPGWVASATSRLDLSKLTMADFGDVEQPR